MSNKTRPIGYGTADVKKKVPIPESINFKTKAVIKIMPQLKDQIDYLHQMIGNKEWSGILFYKIKKGSMDAIDKVVIEAHYVMPLNMGSAVYTEYDPDEAAIDAFDMFKDSEDMERGTIHTHHNMAAFFSSTDTEDLLEKVADNSHSYYLSLIVNIQETYVAKVAVLSKTSYTEYSVNIGRKQHPIRMPNTKITALTFEVSVKLPPGKEMPLPFRKQVEKIIEASKVSQTPARRSARGTHYYNDYYDTEIYNRAIHAKAGTKEIPGVGEKKEEKKEKIVERASFKDLIEELESFGSLITVGHEFGSIQEVISCETTEELMNVVADSIEFYSGADVANEGRTMYHTQLKEYIISSLFETEDIVSVPDIQKVVTGLLDVLLAMPECKRKPTDQLVESTKIVLYNMKVNAFNVLTDYKSILQKAK